MQFLSSILLSLLILCIYINGGEAKSLAKTVHVYEKTLSDFDNLKLRPKAEQHRIKKRQNEEAVQEEPDASLNINFQVPSSPGSGKLLLFGAIAGFWQGGRQGRMF